MFKYIFLALFLFIFAPLDFKATGLQDKIDQIDRSSSGNLGVYIKNLENGQIVNHNADRTWYLASVVKIPLVIALYQQVEQGAFSLDDELVLQESDFVDGSGDLLWHEPGTSFTIRELIDKTLKDSDSTATDMLLRFLGEEKLNQMVRENMVSNGLDHITTILQVRYDAYSELHPNAAKLSNMDIVTLRGISPVSTRLDEMVRLMNIDKEELGVNTIPEAFERYYTRNLNSGRLESMGLLLERLVDGELLSEAHTEELIEVMADISTGDRRIKAGLPEGTRFSQKTGTQIGRACNAGIVYPPNGQKPVVVAACMENYNSVADVEQALQQVGRAIGDTWE